jgi:hypothetical protein
LSQFDEDAYLRKITSPSYTHTFLARLDTKIDLKKGKKRLARLYSQRKGKKQNDLDLWLGEQKKGGESTPPERYQANLRRFADLLQENGIQLILIKEPMRGDRPWIWKEEFYDIMDRLGESYDLPVVDLTPALERSGGRSLFMDDVHPLPDGNRVIAQTLAPVIESVILKRMEERNR